MTPIQIPVPHHPVGETQRAQEARLRINGYEWDAGVESQSSGGMRRGHQLGCLFRN